MFAQRPSARMEQTLSNPIMFTTTNWHASAHPTRTRQAPSQSRAPQVCEHVVAQGSITISPQDVDVLIAWRTRRASARLFAAQPALGDEAFAAIRAESLHSALGVPRGLPAAAANNAPASPAPALPSPHAAQQLSVLRRAAAGRTPATVGDQPFVVEPRARSLFLYI